MYIDMLFFFTSSLWIVPFFFFLFFKQRNPFIVSIWVAGRPSLHHKPLGRGQATQPTRCPRQEGQLGKAWEKAGHSWTPNGVSGRCLGASNRKLSYKLGLIPAAVRLVGSGQSPPLVQRLKLVRVEAFSPLVIESDS